jgi:plasmid stabilization system protein ParE
MRVRYTDPASFELERAVSYFIEHAPASASAFADSIDAAVARVLENPYSTQETDIPVLAVRMSAAFATRFSTPSREMRS